MHSEPGGLPGRDDAAGDIDAAVGELFEHEPAGGVVADHADEGDPQAQPSRAAGHDRRRAADRQRTTLDQRLGLAEGDLDGDVPDDDVGHGVAGHEQVGGPAGGASGCGRFKGGGRSGPGGRSIMSFRRGTHLDRSS